ncbi:MAG: nucleoside hydrolase [Candidatus Hydrogenedentes bacterium]|nr:nucleoside hydrolase [Candidatus Hydrogenedentota bacterium]
MEPARMACLFVAFLGLAAATAWAGAGAQTRPVPLIHMTDLYHPHGDPDDHWDLATVYALAKAGHVNLLGIVIDYPPSHRVGGPALCAVGQMNHIAGLAVPVAIGSARPDGPAGTGADFVIRTLRESPEPVTITVVGSCRDIALAGRKAPEVFAAKCRAIYLNAGTGTTDPAKGANTEYNVRLDPESYRAVFNIPCPVYWLPCFDEMVFADGGPKRVMRYGSLWAFRQGQILPRLSAPVQNFFLYALKRSDDACWLRYLGNEIDTDALAEFGRGERRMWCTAGFFHLAGLAVSRQGALVRLDEQAGQDVLYRFEPISLSLVAEGVGHWEKAGGESQRFIIEIEDTALYPECMARALGELLEIL